MLWWVPYHTDFAKFSEKRNRGKQIAFLSSITSVIQIITPVISGWVIITFGFPVVFFMGLILQASAVLPLLFLPEVNERFSWSIGRAYKEFLSKKNRKMVVAYMGDGAQNIIGVVVWPLFIWQLLEGDFLKVGIVSALIVLTTVILRLAIGDYIDRFSKKKVMRLGTILASLGWFGKIFVITAFQIYIVAAYHNFALIFLRVPFDTLMYEQAADSGHYVDEYTVLRELAIQFGKIIALSLLILFIGATSLYWAFILGIIASLLINLVTKYEGLKYF